MKKVLLLILTSALFTLPLHAQLKLGVKAGVNLANVNSVYTGSSASFNQFSSRTTFHVGALAQVPLLNKLSFQAEALLNGKGGTVAGVNGGEDSPLQLYYVSVPLLAVFKPVEAIGLQAGVELGFLASARSKVGDKTFDVADDYQDRDLGLVAGAQAQIKRFNIDARYVYGLTKIQEIEFVDLNGGAKSTAKYSNSVIQVSLGYLLLK